MVAVLRQRAFVEWHLQQAGHKVAEAVEGDGRIEKFPVGPMLQIHISERIIEVRLAQLHGAACGIQFAQPSLFELEFQLVQRSQSLHRRLEAVRICSLLRGTGDYIRNQLLRSRARQRLRSPPR